MEGRPREGPILMGRAANKSARFTARMVCGTGFWRNWGVWGDRSPRSAIRGRGAGRGIVLAGAITLGVLLEFIAWVLLWTCVWPREPIDMSWE